jgi:signal transduction histidine kinase
MQTAEQPQVAETGLSARLTDAGQRERKQQAVRGGQLAMVILVLAAVAGALAADGERFEWWRTLALAGLGILYILWNLQGTRDVVRLVLEEADTPQPAAATGECLRYFGVQFLLAGLIFHLGNLGHANTLLWLVLLPPVAHSIILLSRAGIMVVCLASIALLAANVVRWEGWAAVPYGTLAFSFAVLFTLVFTQLAVSAERARSQVQRLAEALARANAKLRAYAVQAEELSAIRERNRLAREIHDSLGHYLTVVNVQLEAARALWETDPARARTAVQQAQTLNLEGLQGIRRSVAALRASPLDGKTLGQALEQLAGETTGAGLRVDWRLLGTARPLSPAAELTFFRAAQEGLTNVRKHARTSGACLQLDFSAARSTRLTVRDEGGGAPADVGGGFGLLGLRERALLLGGAATVQTAPGQGFTLQVEVPE